MGITHDVHPAYSPANDKAAILVALRDVCAAALLLMSLVPETSSRYILIPTLAAWLILALLANARAFEKTFATPTIRTYSVYAWLFLHSILQLSGSVEGAGIDRLFMYSRLGFTILFFSYYLEAKDYRAIKGLTWFSLVCIVWTCLTTLRGLAFDPMAARLLATGVEQLTQDLVGMAIGSFGFIYGLVFVAVAIVGIVKTAALTKERLILAMVCVIAIYTIFSAAFMTALLLLATSVTLLSLNLKRPALLIPATMVLFGLLLALSPNVASLLVYIGDMVEHDLLAVRFYDLAQVFNYGAVGGAASFEGRLYFLTLSVETFLANPFFGVGGYYGFDASIYGIGGHSTAFDELAKYGVFGGSLLLVVLISNAASHYRRLSNDSQRTVYLCALSTFFLLSIVNPILFIPLLMMIYFVVPGLLCTFWTEEDPKHVGRLDVGENPVVRKYPSP